MQTTLTGIRRRFAGVLAVCMTAVSGLGSLPAMNAHAVGGSCGANATWELTDGKLTISGSGPVNSAAWGANRSQITSVVVEDGITSLPMNAFNNYTEMVSLKMADSVTSIGSMFCFNCSALQTIELSSAIKDIPSSSFYYCRSLENLKLPEQLETIGSSAFYGALGLTELTLPDTVISIGTSAFYGNNIKKLTLSSSLEEIGSGAFDMSCFASVTIPPTVTSIGSKAFTPYYNSVTYENNRFNGKYVNAPGITTIYGAAGSEAERFAKEAGLNFVAVEQSGHTHSWSEWTVDTPPTCAAVGKNVRTCAECGEKEYREIPTVDHEWGSWETGMEPGCTTEGTVVRKCINCGETETRSVAANGHSWGYWVTDNPATCESDGDMSRSCTVCGEKEYQTILALGGTHSWSEWNVTKEPSKTEEGEQMRECEKCGQIETQTLPRIDAVTYTVSISANSGGTVDPSGEVLVEEGENLTVTITPADDMAVSDVIVDGVSVGAMYTYTFRNVTGNHTLEVVFVSDMPQPHNHVWSDWEVVLPASCEAAGTESHRCYECGETEERSIPATGHNWSEWEVVLPASCETAGQESHRCSGCEKTEERSIPATGHNWLEWEILKEPTTSEAGERGRSCSNCHEKQTESIPKLDAVTYTISITANEGGTVSPVGNQLVEEGSSLTVQIMPSDDWKVSDVRVDGVSVGAVYSYTFENITANHTLEVLFAGEMPHAHIWSEWSPVTPVSCETDGKETRSCTACGETEERVIPATGHNWTEWHIEKEPTTTEQGRRERYCTNCDAYEVQSIPMLEVVTYTITVTANEGGNVLPSTSTVEAGSSLTIEILPHTEHDVKDVLVDGVSVGAVYSYTFENISANHTLEVIFEVMPLPHEHTWSEWNTERQASCETDGERVRRCTECGETERESIPATGHKWTDWYITQQPTVDSEGVQQRRCEICGVTESESVPKLESYVITITYNEGGSVWPNGETRVAAGGELSVWMGANGGYRLGDVLMDGVSVLADVQYGGYTFKNVTANHTLSVIFIKDEPQEIRECVEMIVTPKRAAWLNDEASFDISDFTVTAVISENGKITQIDITGDCAILETPAAAPGLGTFAVTVNYQGGDSDIGAYADQHTVKADVEIALRGDVDGNGTVDASDAMLALREYLEIVVVHGKESTLTPVQAVIADVNNDGTVFLDDATAILRYYLESFVGNHPSWRDIVS